jgi:hypothetical protein
VLLPLEWRDWTAEQLRAVLAHEIAHIARHDFLACVLAQAGLALHFYHPLVHWLVRRLRLEQELAADAAAAMATGGRAAYLQSLAELALRQSERPLGWPARTFLPTRGTFMRRIEMLRDAKNSPAGESRWLAWPRRVAVLLLIIGAAAVAGLRGGAPPAEVAQAQDKPKIKEEAKESQPDTGEISLSQLPSDCLAFAAIRIQPLLKNPETAEVLRKLDQRTDASKAAVPLEKLSQLTFVLRSDEPLERSDAPVVIVEASEPVDFSKALLAEENGKQIGMEEVKEEDLKPGTERPTIVFIRLNDRSAAFGTRGTLAHFVARKRGGPALTRGDGWKKVSGLPLVLGIDMMALRRLAPPGGDSPALALKEMGLAPLWDETESIAAGITLEKKADILVVAECLGEKGAVQAKETASAGAIIVRNMLREVRSARLKQAADNIGARTLVEPEFVQLLYDAADKALSNVKVEQDLTLVAAQASVDLKGRAGTLAALVPSMQAIQVNSRRAQSGNNIRQIMLAMHNYADTYGGKFPPAVIYGKDGKGKVPHSWRVELLPYLEQEALYRAYQFDEPWDSEANKKVLSQMPAVFRDPSADPKSTSAAYFVMVGKMDDAKKEGKPRGGGEENGKLGAGGAGAAAPGGGPPGAAGSTPESRFDKTVVDYVNETLLKPWDKDGDGFLDSTEWKAVKWSANNPPQNSDLDKDGKLSRDELCLRLSKSRGIPIKEEPAEAGVQVDTNLATAFSKKEGIRFSEITDGTSNTIAIVEAKRDIPWTKPEDIPYDPKVKAPKLGGFYEDGFWVGICDGSVNFLPGNITEDSLRAYLSPAAGDQIAPQKELPTRPKLNEVDNPKPRNRTGR